MTTPPPDPETVLTLDDLRAWTRSAPSFAVLGQPVVHSRSPRMHNAALDILRRERRLDAGLADAAYFKFEVPPARLAEALPLFLEKNFRGLNLTLPHKIDALALVPEATAAGRAAGALNTLVATPGGSRWRGHNTDGAGFRIAARSRIKNLNIAGRPLVLLGAGGAARAIAAACLDAELGACSRLVVAARDAAKAGAFADFFRDNAARVPVGVCALDAPEIPAGALVVNCTPLGLKPGDASPIPVAALRSAFAVYDTTYAAEPSALLRAAESLGLPGENGLSMLCAQGAEALRCWLDPAWSVAHPTPVPVALEPVMFAAIGGVGAFGA